MRNLFNDDTIKRELALKHLEFDNGSELVEKLDAVLAKYFDDEKETVNLLKEKRMEFARLKAKYAGGALNMMLFDATGAELIFEDVDQVRPPVKGDRVTVIDTDGKEKKRFNGECLMPDGTTIVIKNGVVEEVIYSEDPEAFEDLLINCEIIRRNRV